MLKTEKNLSIRFKLLTSSMVQSINLFANENVCYLFYKNFHFELKVQRGFLVF